VSSLDDLVRASLDRIRVSLSGQLEAELAASAGDILRAVTEAEAQAAADAAERAAGEVRSESARQLTELREALEREREEVHRNSVVEIATLQRVIEDVREHLSVARREIEDTRQAHAALERQLDEVRRERDDSRRASEEASDDVTATRQELDDARRAADEHSRQLDDVHRHAAVAQQQLDEANRHTAETRQRLDEVQREGADARREADEVRREFATLQDRLAHAERLMVAMRTLDSAASLGDVLDALARVACQETERAAVFLVNGTRLRAWRALGFDAHQMLVGSDLDAETAGVLGEAVRSGRGEASRLGEGPLLPAFATGNGPRRALALPINVGGSVIAVLYADAQETDRPDDSRWQENLDVMARQAGRALEAITVRHAVAMSTARPIPGGQPQIRGGSA
jgi:uncharacterized coiled-coil DUF342 family protein